MKKICYLHVGMHKTGTSSIQSSFYNVRHILEEKYNFYYYRDHEDSPENAFLSIGAALSYKKPTINLPVFNALKVDDTKKQKNYEHLCHILKTQNTIFISSEIIFVQSKEGLKALNDLIVSYGFEIKVILYVRNPYAFLSSAWQQKLKEGEVLDLGNIQIPNRLKNAYSIWGSVLTVHQFERAHLEGNDLFEDICKWLGKLEFKKYLHSSSENESITKAAAIIGYNLLNDQSAHIHPDYGYDPVFAHTLFRLSEHTPNDEKFILPKSIVKSSAVQEKIKEWLTVLEDCTSKKYDYHSIEFPDYDIGSLDPIHKKTLLHMIRQVYLEHYQLTEDYHSHIAEITRLNQEWSKLNDALKERDQEIARLNQEWGKLNNTLKDRDQEIARLNQEWGKLNNTLKDIQDNTKASCRD